jgi:hypothetical protein
MFQYIVSGGIIIFGVYLVIKPGFVALKLKNFYSNYPLVHYAGNKQLTSQPIYIIIFGIIFILIGIAGFIYI